MDIWSLFINYVEATFLEIQQGLNACDWSIEGITVFTHLFLANAMPALGPACACKLLHELSRLTMTEEIWCNAMRPVKGRRISTGWLLWLGSLTDMALVFLTLVSISSTIPLSSSTARIYLKKAMVMEYLRLNSGVPAPEYSLGR
ncbi:hypothetical protein OE88DRAFT_1654434 [Heliocybe sulcata]|uniref:Uncharacterized protein n=1 Tax=Heliocybe sulcata TaxID=5364 RepID=A0A5C3N9H0_9AGAM|nr:hypothetical protein OE88DRAFT_1654434 [Heliocybe sulcata]